MALWLLREDRQHHTVACDMGKMADKMGEVAPVRALGANAHARTD